MSNPVYENSNENSPIEAAAKKLTRPLWVIAISAAISTLLLVLVVGYGGLQYLSLMNAMSEFGTETSESQTDTSDEGQNMQPCDEQHPDNC